MKTYMQNIILCHLLSYSKTLRVNEVLSSHYKTFELNSWNIKPCREAYVCFFSKVAESSS